MAEKKERTLEETVQVVKHGSKEHDVLLESGYGMTVAEAEKVIKEHTENPLSHPYERRKNAEALLAARKAKPEVISKRPAWKRQHRR